MNIEDKNILYEKLYFAEIETKEKIHNRVQIVFGLIVILSTIITYVLKNTSFDTSPHLAIFTIFLVLLSFSQIAISIFKLKRAFWGNEFRYLISPYDINSYHEELIKYEEKYKEFCKESQLEYNDEYNPSRKLDEYVKNEIVNCTTFNIKTNELRSSQVYESIRFIFYSLIPLVLSVACFLVADLDAASPRKSNLPHYIIVSVQKL